MIPFIFQVHSILLSLVPLYYANNTTEIVRITFSLILVLQLLILNNQSNFSVVTDNIWVFITISADRYNTHVRLACSNFLINVK